ncbi:hypothetical protein T08_13479 [Trichinella sp. T8]|nr:hypothetical protein T08_13479 [Trichinella sp. T8]
MPLAVPEGIYPSPLASWTNSKGEGQRMDPCSDEMSMSRCFVTSSTSDWMPRIDISLHAGNFHSAVRCSRTTILGRPKRALRILTACG